MKKENTKLMKDAWRRYDYSDMYSLDDVYKNCSSNKRKAWKYCEDLCRSYNGRNLKVVGANSMMFSAGFIGEKENDKTGELKNIFVYITKDYDRYMELS